MMSDSNDPKYKERFTTYNRKRLSDKKQVLFYLDNETHAAIKALLEKRDQTMQDFLAGYIVRTLKKEASKVAAANETPT
jgi:hypothetical protein